MRRPSAAIALLALLFWPPLAGVSAAADIVPPAFKPPPLFALPLKKPAPSLVFTYHGFQVDASAAPRGTPPDKAVRQIKAQIDLVEKVGLKPDVLALMRATPILADPTKPNLPGEAAHYVRGRGVVVRIARLAPKKPVVLVGLLQAYADQRLSGPAGQDIARFRGEAAARHVWPKTALMLQSDGDYFALTASAYLYGAITREPYTRANLKQTQPDYVRWLADRFDDGRPRG